MMVLHWMTSPSASFDYKSHWTAQWPSNEDTIIQGKDNETRVTMTKGDETRGTMTKGDETRGAMRQEGQ